MTLLYLLAQTTGPATTPSTPAPAWARPEIVLIVMVGVFLILNMRGKRQQDKKVQDMLGNLKRGDRVQTTGGIIGTVVEARETEVLVKVDETNNTKIRFARKSIYRVLEDETTEKK